MKRPAEVDRNAAQRRARKAPGEDARLFLALWPDPTIRSQLSRRRDAWRWPATAKPVADDRLHLTLHFIGAFSRSAIAALHGSLQAVAVKSMTLRAGEEEVWSGGIAVLRFADDATLAALHLRMGAVLVGMGVSLDARPFSPHVTMARRARLAAPPRQPAPIEWAANGFVLVESLVAPDTGYRVLHRYGESPDIAS